MSNEKMYDPLKGFKQISDLWEQQLNGLLYKMSDNSEFVRLLKVGTDAHSRYMELLRKNQETVAGLMNIPTKSDVSNIAKLSVQAEEKIDSLEEQIWKVQDVQKSSNKEHLGLFQEMVNIVSQMKVEFQKAVEEVNEIRKVKEDLQDIRQGLVEVKIIQVKLQEVRKELEEIKDFHKELIGISSSDDKKNKIIHTDLQELKFGMGQLADIKNELASLKSLIVKESTKGKTNEKEKDLITAK
jgi:chromosome segregation ATPase